MRSAHRYIVSKTRGRVAAQLLLGMGRRLAAASCPHTLLSPAAPAPAPGWLFTYYNSKKTDERKAQIERINDQVRVSGIVEDPAAGSPSRGSASRPIAAAVLRPFVTPHRQLAPPRCPHVPADHSFCVSPRAKPGLAVELALAFTTQHNQQTHNHKHPTPAFPQPCAAGCWPPGAQPDPALLPP